MKRKILWILTMAFLCLVIVVIVNARTQDTTKVIFGGAQGAYIETDRASYVDSSAVVTPEPTVDIWPKIDIEQPQYAMVNGDNLISSAFEPVTDKISGTSNMLFDVAALPYLEAMLQDCRDAGHTVIVNASYRTYSFQYKLFNSKASQIAYGYGVSDYNDPLYQKAAEEAKRIVMFPGSSEHQLGLAVDLADKMYSYFNYDSMDQELFAWLDEHCAEYGFIKRYPTRKMLLTGWDEPWHYRYVGKEAAEFIMEQGICYEEFYAHYVDGFKY